MNIAAAISLRDRLRADTRGPHEALDLRMSEFDLTSAEGLAGFLRVQHAALTALAPRATRAESAGAIVDLATRAARDLTVLGGTPPARAEIALPPLDPLAVDYIVAGSRLGGQVLRRRWQQSTDPVVRAADAYFSAPEHLDLWRGFVTRAGAMDGQGARAETVIDDALAIFALYSGIAEAVRDV